MSPVADAVRRAIDVAAAAVGLLLLAPLLAFLALALRVRGTRSVIHRDVRVGRHGRPFAMHKLRTLRAGGEQPSVAAAGDPRITALGAFLRRWRLDELPQLWDVLVGRMGLVGPRPQQPANLAAIDPALLARLQRVRPGLTGPAAVEFLAEDEALAEVADPVEAYRRIVLPAKVALEVEYLEHRSLARDAGILLRTAVRLFSRRARRRSLARVRALLAAGART